MALSKKDWTGMGLKILSSQGEEAIKIEILCKELKVSKGSFYHHFKNVEDFIEGLMKHWELENTMEIIEDSEAKPTADEKIKELNEIVMAKDHLLEVRIRAWSVRNNIVKKYIHKADLLRMNYLKTLYLDKGVDEEKANQFSKLEYAAFIGMQHLFGNISKEEKTKLSDTFIHLIQTEINKNITN